ncbi:MAG: peptidylprolyl isomerase [Acidobacteria bacterium]|nr:MAG: peptidylprolyl isomerase [Acidobacteriota bacterium]
MKKTIGLLFVLALLFACNQGKENAVKTDQNADKGQTEMKKAVTDQKAYALGYRIGKDLASSGVTLDWKTVKTAMSDAVEGREPALDEEVMMKAFKEFQMEAQNKQREKMQQAATKNNEEAAKWLAENASKEGVKTTDSGLQYKVITMGKGKKPTASDKVKVHYKGTLVDGTEFDSSYKRNKPAEFPLGGVIKGWTEGLQLMPVGSKFVFYIPPELGYGPSGAGSIPPGAALVFEVELLDILK